MGGPPTLYLGALFGGLYPCVSHEIIDVPSYTMYSVSGRSIVTKQVLGRMTEGTGRTIVIDHDLFSKVSPSKRYESLMGSVKGKSWVTDKVVNEWANSFSGDFSEVVSYWETESESVGKKVPAQRARLQDLVYRTFKVSRSLFTRTSAKTQKAGYPKFAAQFLQLVLVNLSLEGIVDIAEEKKPTGKKARKA